MEPSRSVKVAFVGRSQGMGDRGPDRAAAAAMSTSLNGLFAEDFPLKYLRVTFVCRGFIATTVLPFFAHTTAGEIVRDACHRIQVRHNVNLDPADHALALLEDGGSAASPDMVFRCIDSAYVLSALGGVAEALRAGVDIKLTLVPLPEHARPPKDATAASQSPSPSRRVPMALISDASVVGNDRQPRLARGSDEHSRRGFTANSHRRHGGDAEPEAASRSSSTSSSGVAPMSPRVLVHTSPTAPPQAASSPAAASFEHSRTAQDVPSHDAPHVASPDVNERLARLEAMVDASRADVDVLWDSVARSASGGGHGRHPADDTRKTAPRQTLGDFFVKAADPSNAAAVGAAHTATSLATSATAATIDFAAPDAVPEWSHAAASPASEDASPRAVDVGSQDDSVHPWLRRSVARRRESEASAHATPPRQTPRVVQPVALGVLGERVVYVHPLLPMDATSKSASPVRDLL